MRTQLSTEELVQRVRRSGLVAPADLDVALIGFPWGHPADRAFRLLLDRLVAERLLTPFQVERLAVGKYKGFRLGSYVILDRIGTGGMGQVYLAEHATLRRRTAVKVLPVPVGEDDVARERFLREARASAGLDHPNIVRVFDLNQEGDLLYLVMEYVEGLSLQTLVARTGPVPPVAAADYARQAALGLQHAHERGFVHRDVKPGNVLVDRQGTARVLDLGLVREVDAEDSQLTRKLGGKGVLGTVDYLAPEQAVDSSAVDHRADVYSLGATLYFLLAGRPMFPDGRAAQKLVWQQTIDPDPITRVNPAVPPELAAVVHTALAKKPADRFQTAWELADALTPFAVGPYPPAVELVPIPPEWRTGGGSLAGPGSSVVLRGLSADRPASGASSRVLPKTPRPPVPPAAETDSGKAEPTAGGSGRPRVPVRSSHVLSVSAPETPSPVAPAPPAPGRRVPLGVVLGLVGAAALIGGVVAWLLMR